MTSKDQTNPTGPIGARTVKSLIAAGLAGLTILLYQQVQSFDFINFDDYEYLVNNPHVRYGLSLESLLWAFTRSYSFNWHPLTWISHMLDCQLFGLNPGAHHMTNLLLHTANTLLLFHVFNRMTQSLWRSGLTAALFSLHPLHVESVAWISERKDVLSAFFFLITVLAYLRYTQKPGPGRYLLIPLFFALGLMSKPMIVTLPFVLLLLDYWPLQRHQDSAARLILEKIPLFLFSAASGLVTYLIHDRGGSISALPLALRIENGLLSYTLYLWKTFWPVDLSCFYPHPFASLGYKATGGGLLLLTISVAVLSFMKKLPYLATGWLWFLGMLIPVSGIIQAGGHSMADRYTYIPLIGVFIILSWGCTDLFDKIKLKAQWRPLLAVVLALPLLIASYKQISYWRNSFTLFERQLMLSEQKHIGYTLLGSSYDLSGDRDLAVAYLSEALRIMPDYEEARFGLANSLSAKGELVEAEKLYTLLLRQNPHHYKALHNVGLVLVKLGREEEALSCFRRAHRINPGPKTERSIEQLLEVMKKRSSG